MGAIASQITSLTIVYSTVYPDADQRKHQSSASLAFVRGIHRGPASNAENVSIWWRHHVVGVIKWAPGTSVSEEIFFTIMIWYELMQPYETNNQ